MFLHSAITCSKNKKFVLIFGQYSHEQLLDWLVNLLTPDSEALGSILHDILSCTCPALGQHNWCRESPYWTKRPSVIDSCILRALPLSLRSRNQTRDSRAENYALCRYTTCAGGVVAERVVLRTRVPGSTPDRRESGRARKIWDSITDGRVV